MSQNVTIMPSIQDFERLASRYGDDKHLRLRDNNTVGTPWLYNSQARNTRTMQAFIGAIRAQYGDMPAILAVDHLYGAARSNGGYLTAGMVRDGIAQARSDQGACSLTSFFTDAVLGMDGLHKLPVSEAFDNATAPFGPLPEAQRNVLFALAHKETQAHFRAKIDKGEPFTQEDMAAFMRSCPSMLAFQELKEGGCLDQVEGNFKCKLELGKMFSGHLGIAAFVMQRLGAEGLREPLTRENIWAAVSNRPMPQGLADANFKDAVEDAAHLALTELLPNINPMHLGVAALLSQSVSLEAMREISTTGRTVTAEDFFSHAPFPMPAHSTPREEEGALARDISRIETGVDIGGKRTKVIIPHMTLQDQAGSERSFILSSLTDHDFEPGGADAQNYHDGLPSSLSRQIIQSVEAFCGQGRERQAAMTVLFCTQAPLFVTRMFADLLNIGFSEHVARDTAITHGENGNVHIHIATPQGGEVERVQGSLSMDIDIRPDGAYRLTDLQIRQRAAAQIPAGA